MSDELLAKAKGYQKGSLLPNQRLDRPGDFLLSCWWLPAHS